MLGILQDVCRKYKVSQLLQEKMNHPQNSLVAE
jgi:hypothetical protein